MRKELTITSVEQEMDALADSMLLTGSITAWATLVRRFHALGIKLYQLKGEQPEVTHGRTDYII